MRLIRTLLLAASAAGILAGCGGGGSTGASVNNSATPGTLIENPPLRVASLNAKDLTAQISNASGGSNLLTLVGSLGGLPSGVLPCGIDYHYIQYATVGGNATNPEQTTATGVLMVPTGPAPQCSGPRPIVLYAHGTNTDKTYNLAAVTDSTNAAATETGLISAMFAAQGYIVVAPNYAGYDTSPLPYHPYLNATQQSTEMINALTAARSALGHIFASGTTDNGKLFVTGYSQGGHVAMATQRAMLKAGMTVTAAAPMSGPYALEAFGDAVFFGDVDLGSTVFAPLLTTSYQKEYGNIYTATTDIYTSTYATGIDTLLPNAMPMTTLFQQNKLPQTAFFNSVAPTGTGSPTLDGLFASITPPTTPAAEAPLFALGFAPSNYLINNTYRVAYVADAAAHPDGVVPTVTTGMPAASPANTLRQAFKANDLRGWTPPSTSPVMLCGGQNDPTVFYAPNTGTMATLWAPLVTAGLVTVVNVDPGTSAPSGPFAALQAGFLTTENAVATAAATAVAAAGGNAAAQTAAAQSAVTQNYHGTLVPPFCAAAAFGFFSHF
jgi:hypothetical protein